MLSKAKKKKKITCREIILTKKKEKKYESVICEERIVCESVRKIIFENLSTKVEKFFMTMEHLDRLCCI